jgi:hypothetical protein
MKDKATGPEWFRLPRRRNERKRGELRAGQANAEGNAMGPLRKPVDRSRFDETEKIDIPGAIESEAPEPAGPDWESMEGAVPDTEIRPGDGDAGEGIESAVRSGFEESGELPGEEDDNPDQESDEALPDEAEEHAIRRDMAGRGIRYEPE